MDTVTFLDSNLKRGKGSNSTTPKTLCSSSLRLQGLVCYRELINFHSLLTFVENGNNNYLQPNMLLRSFFNPRISWTWITQCCLPWSRWLSSSQVFFVQVTLWTYWTVWRNHWSKSFWVKTNPKSQCFECKTEVFRYRPGKAMKLQKATGCWIYWLLTRKASFFGRKTPLWFRLVANSVDDVEAFAYLQNI